MKQIIYVEFNNCIKSVKYKMVFIVLYLLCLYPFLINCYKYYGNNLSSIRSASEMSLNMGTYSIVIKDVLVLLLPLLASILYSDSFITDYTSGTYKNIITRVDKKKYMLAKVFVTFFVVFLTFFSVFAINEILTAIAFPINGYDNNFSLPAYDKGYYNYNNKWFLDLIRIQSPYLYNLIFILIQSIMASLFAVCSLVLSFIIKEQKLKVLFSILIIYTLSDIILSLFKLQQFSIKSYLYSMNKGEGIILLAWIGALILSIIFMFFYSEKKELDI